jgi:hypothetical protein
MQTIRRDREFRCLPHRAGLLSTRAPRHGEGVILNGVKDLGSR